MSSNLFSIRSISLAAIGLLSMGSVVALANPIMVNAAIPSIGRSETIINKKPIAVASLTGTYSCNDGGTYYLRQIGNQLWWFGQSGDDGATWSNVFKGTIRGRTVSGTWADVPKGTIQSGGVMNIQRLSVDKFRVINQTGNFGGTEWTRK